MSDARLSTRRLPEGVVATPFFGEELRRDGTPRDRFLLSWQHPDLTGPPNLFTLMNPSGAGADVADQTLLKCRGFSSHWNRGPFTVTNVNPFRATSPKEMEFHVDALWRNQTFLLEAAQNVVAMGGKVVVAWGSPGLPKDDRIVFDYWAREQVYKTLLEAGASPLCLGVNADGNPMHPLTLAYNRPLVSWNPR